MSRRLGPYLFKNYLHLSEYQACLKNKKQKSSLRVCVSVSVCVDVRDTLKQKLTFH